LRVHDRHRTITRRLTSIAKTHQAARFDGPPASTHHIVVGETLKGIRRTIGTAQHGKDPLLSVDIRRIVRMSRKDLLVLRGRALTLVCFCSGVKRVKPQTGTYISNNLMWLLDSISVIPRFFSLT
jgi:hypothetical protein